MSRVYATTDDGERVLVRLECDGCEASIKPNPEITKSGWMVRGWYDATGGQPYTTEWCPNCAKE